MLLHADCFYHLHVPYLLTCAGRSAEELSGTHLEAQCNVVASMDLT